MGKELVPFKVSNLPVLADKQVAEIDEVSKGTEYLPRIQLISKGKYVDTGKIAPGRWGIPLPGGEDITDLGPSIDVIPFWARTRKPLSLSSIQKVPSTIGSKPPLGKRTVGACTARTIWFLNAALESYMSCFSATSLVVMRLAR